MDCHFGKERMAVANPGGRFFTLSDDCWRCCVRCFLDPAYWVLIVMTGKRLSVSVIGFGIMAVKLRSC